MLAGALRCAATFIPTSGILADVEWLYLVIDILLLFGVMGVYFYQAAESGLFGLAGFVLAVIGIESIGGPDGMIGTVDVYSTGSSIIGIGMLLLGIGSLAAGKLPRYVPVLWMLSTGVGAAAMFAKTSEFTFPIAGVLFGLGFVGAGVHILGDRGAK